MLEFFGACSLLADEILRAIAIGLGLPFDFLVLRHNQRQHTLRLLHYPPLLVKPQPGQYRAGAHSDYGSLTLLFQDPVGGLEVQSIDGTWISAPVIPRTVLVNIGDLMERWTNRTLRSTKHRVILPSPPYPHQSRYSVAFFCHPNDEVEITCLAPCQGPDQPSLYPPILAKDYLLSRLRATY